MLVNQTSQWFWGKMFANLKLSTALKIYFSANQPLKMKHQLVYEFQFIHSFFRFVCVLTVKVWFYFSFNIFESIHWKICFYFVESKMGRRKKASKPPPKRKILEPLDIQFNCPFCNHEKSCEVKMWVLTCLSKYILTDFILKLLVVKMCWYFIMFMRSTTDSEAYLWIMKY